MKISSKYIIAVVALCPFAVGAQDPSTIADALNDNGVITVVQPAALNQRLVPVRSSHSNDAESLSDSAPVKVKAGYRVQVFDDNNVRSAKSEAQARKSQIAARFPDLPIYVTFSSPYWRVKVGDFKTRGEAEAAMGEIKHAFPAMAKSLRIVRDRINQR